jgi:hypothetical protein
MPVVSRRQRLGALRILGISDAIIELAAGNNRRATFDYYCTSPYMIYDCEDAPEGDPLVPLWEDRGGGATAVRPGETGLEFVQFSVEAPEEHRIVARTEQGLLAHLFITLYEACDEPANEAALSEDAASVGFNYYSELVSAYDAAEHSTFEEHESFVRDFVASIDRRALGNTSA